MNQNETNDLVLFSEHKSNGGKVGRISLNQPKKLNALSTKMYQLILDQLKVWQLDPRLQCVFLESKSEKAFSAGGDVKGLVIDILKENYQAAKEFFTKEYFADYSLSVFAKPIVVFGHGYVMGGGWGVFRSCSHRLVTEASVFSMPEISIGLFPDVGASYFLPQLGEELGLYLGLTGARFSGRDACDLGVTDFMVQKGQREEIFEGLLMLELANKNKKEKDDLIKGFMCGYHSDTCGQRSLTTEKREAIQNLGLGESFEIADAKLRKSSSTELKEDVLRYKAGPEISRRVIYKLLTEYKSINYKEALIKEWHLALNFCKAQSFREGVRALLIDKDKSPQWPKYQSQQEEQLFIKDQGQELEQLIVAGK